MSATPEAQQRLEQLWETLPEEMERRATAIKLAPKYIAASAQGIDAMCAIEPALYRGLAGSARKEALKARVRTLVDALKSAVDDQLGNGTVARLDLDDGDYDNVDLDTVLRQNYSKMRNIRIDLGRWYSFKRVRKFKAMLTEDVPNWFRQKKRSVFDGIGEVAKKAGIATAVTAAGIGGAALYFGGWDAMSSAAASGIGSVRSFFGRTPPVA